MDAGVLEFVYTGRIAGGPGETDVDLSFYGPTSFGGSSSNQLISTLAAELGDQHLDLGKTFGIRRIRLTYWSIFLGGLVSQDVFTRDQFLLLNLNFKSPVAQTPAAAVKWTFSSKSQRAAAGVFSDADLYKVALQVDEQSWWVLVGHTAVPEDTNVRTPIWESQDLRSQTVCGVIAWRPILFFLPTGSHSPYRAYLDVYSVFPFPSTTQRNAKDQRILFSNERNDSRATGMVRTDGAFDFFATYGGRLTYNRGSLPFVVGTQPDHIVYGELKAAVAAKGPFALSDVGLTGIMQPYSDYLFGAVLYRLTSVDGDFTLGSDQTRLFSLEFLNTDV